MKQRSFAALAVFVLGILIALPAMAERPLLDDASQAVVDQRPAAYWNLTGPVALSVAMPEGAFGETVVATEVGDQRVVASGLRLFPGEVVHRGAFINRGVEPLRLQLGDGSEVAVEPGEGVVVAGLESRETTGGTEPGEIAAAPCDSCSVTCGAGFYACCNNGGLFSCAKCRCVANGTTKSCDSGGPGSTMCSVGGATAALAVDF